MQRAPRRAAGPDGPVGAVAESAFAPFRVPHFGKLYLGGFLWSVCRWALGFLGSYVVNQKTGSPRLVQLTGTMMWGPLLLGGVIGGAVADRFERRRIVLIQFAALLPLVVLMALGARADQLTLWLIYPFMVAVGIGWVIDMTARRALIYDVVGDRYVNAAMALEQFSSAIGLAVGALAGGAFIQWLGVSSAYFAVAAAMGLALIVLARVPRQPSPAAAPTITAVARAPFFRTVIEGFRALPANPALVSILGVTLIVNVFHFSYFPIVTIIAKRVHATPSMTGLLAAATGFGMAAGALWVVARRPARGKVYVIGSFIGFAVVLGFAQFRHYVPVFLSLLVASGGVGGYGAVQSSLVLTTTDDALRGRAMGLLSMAIGGLPIGMYGLGELAQHIGAPAALTIFNVTGFAILVVFLRRRPEAWHQL